MLLVDDHPDHGHDDSRQDQSGEAVHDLADGVEFVSRDIAGGEVGDRPFDRLRALIDANQEIPIREHRSG